MSLSFVVWIEANCISADDTYRKTSQLGGILQRLVDNTFKSLTEAND